MAAIVEVVAAAVDVAVATKVAILFVETSWPQGHILMPLRPCSFNQLWDGSRLTFWPSFGIGFLSRW